jgi:hypothetical protein
VRIAAVLALLAGLAVAQPAVESQRQSASVSGVVLDADREIAGEFSLHLKTHEVVRYRYDVSTLVHRERRTATAPVLQAGDCVEVDSAPVTESPLRYATAVRVTEAAEPVHMPRPQPAPYHPDSYVSPSDRLLLARGNVQVAGMVARFEDGQLVIRTRLQGEQTFHLRPDTRYLEGGARVTPADLKPDTRVFVRAGRDLFGANEVYEVAWGQILEPR